MPLSPIMIRPAVCALLAALSPAAFASATSTQLTLSASSVTNGQPVTLAATVSDAQGPVRNGTVLFCDTVRFQVCTPFSVNLLGSAHLTAAGMASYKLRFGGGAHSITAKFMGTTVDGGSSSSAQPLSVSVAAINPIPTITSVKPFHNFSNSSYSLAATVLAPQSAVSPAGTVGFQVFGGVTTTSLGNLALTAVPSSTSTPSFASPTGTASSSALAVGDFNEDGIADLIQSSLVSGTSLLTLALGIGDGTFQSASSISEFCFGFGCQSAVSADFNGDGHLDLAAFEESFGGALSVQVAYGKGDGTFTISPSISLPFAPSSFSHGIFTGDFDGDGRADIVVLADVYPTQAEEGAVLLQQADGTFVASPAMPLNGVSKTLMADVNNDGLTDIVNFANAGNFGPTADLVVYLNSGDGTFSPRLTPIPNYVPTSAYDLGDMLVFADLSGTGVPDLVLLNENYSWAAALRNDGQGNFTPQTDFVAAGNINAGPGGLAVLDLNNDGRADLMFVDVGKTIVGGGCSPADYAEQSNGDGTFTLVQATQLPSVPYCGGNGAVALVADLNGDGLPDIVSPTNDSTLINISGWGAASALLQSPFPVNALGYALTLSAIYTPSGNFAASASSPVSVQGQLINTTATLSSPSSVLFNQPVQITATVSPSSVNGYSTDGDLVAISLSQSATGFPYTYLQEATLSGGVAAVTFNNLPVNQYTVSAVYQGDTNFDYSNAPFTTLQITVPNPGDTRLDGDYVFHFHGTLPSSAGSIPGVSAVGWFHADGAGNITAGSEDVNAALFTQSSSALTGSFALAADGTGTLTLVNAQGITQNFGVVTNPPTTTYPSSGVSVTASTQLSLIGLVNGGSVLSGSAVVAPANAASLGLSGAYLLRAEGDTACPIGCTAHGSGQVSLLGTLTAAGGTLTGTAAENAGGSVALDPSTTLTVSTPDARGRVTATHANNFGYTDQPQHYVGYWATPSELYLMSIDPHASNILLSGSLTQ